jgi:hypothetical protein
MSSSDRVRWGALVALLGAVAWIAAGVVDLVTVGLASLEEVLILMGLLGTLGGLVGVHCKQVMSYGRLQKLLSKLGGHYGGMGTAGFLVAFIGSLILLISLALSLVGVGSILELISPGLIVVALIGTFVGYVLLGIASVRAKVFPQWCGLLLIVCLPVAVTLGNHGGGIVLGLVWVGLSYELLWQGKRSALF